MATSGILKLPVDLHDADQAGKTLSEGIEGAGKAATHKALLCCACFIEHAAQCHSTGRQTAVRRQSVNKNYPLGDYR